MRERKDIGYGTGMTPSEVWTGWVRQMREDMAAILTPARMRSYPDPSEGAPTAN